MRRIATVRAVLQRVDNAGTSWAQLVIAVFDRVIYRNPWIPSQFAYGFPMRQTGYNDFISIIRRKELVDDVHGACQVRRNIYATSLLRVPHERIIPQYGNTT